MNAIILKGTFNDVAISRHRTVEAAVKASAKHSRAIERANGRGSYITYSIRAEDGSDIREKS